MPTQHMPLPWLKPASTFPEVGNAWGRDSDAPGLLAAGGDLSVSSLLRAYGSGVFPWFSEGQPILWWSPDPRMVLKTSDFQVRRSLRQAIKRFVADEHCEIRFNTAFQDVIVACAQSPRRQQNGTWILPAMVQAYIQLHQAGHAHSVETWIDDRLVGGLYCVAIGKAVFGESMFTRVSDGSKIALAALVAFCRENGIESIDCQQNTAHLATMGASEEPRSAFLNHVAHSKEATSVQWNFNPLYWNHILSA